MEIKTLFGFYHIQKKPSADKTIQALLSYLRIDIYNIKVYSLYTSSIIYTFFISTFVYKLMI